MKKILILSFLLISTFVISQTVNSPIIPDSLKLEGKIAGKLSNTNQIAATCASPSGSMIITIGTPPSYAWLQTNGYCHPAAYGSSGTVCWSFVPTSNSVTINSGYSSTGCAIITFGPFNLYTCAPACALQGSGLGFAVTPGQCYTWCMGYNGVGGGCSFNDFCPYYQQTTILPIELLYFAGTSLQDINVLKWKTATETNNSYFGIETSIDAVNWTEMTRVKGAGDSHTSIEYNAYINDYPKAINYYRLKQVDYDGSYKYHGIIAINNSISSDVKILYTKNILGQDVDSNYQGIVFVYYENGNIIKKINNQ